MLWLCRFALLFAGELEAAFLIVPSTMITSDFFWFPRSSVSPSFVCTSGLVGPVGSDQGAASG